jgi:hypothetical protein
VTADFIASAAPAVRLLKFPRMHPAPGIFAVILLFAFFFLLCAAIARAGDPSPENQVFQWHATGENAGWPDGSKNTGTLYLWIPEKTRQVRGVVVMATNVPEHRLVGHPAIRRACAENDLALVWGVPTFWRFGKMAAAPGGEPVDLKNIPDNNGIQVRFLERLLADLAEKSGYSELATAPWFPIGESGHLLMVCGMIDERPERTIAGICVKNPHSPKDRTVPLLWTLGTAQEWPQAQSDVRTAWVEQARGLGGWVGERARTGWPLSGIIEPGTGHFYCTEGMAEYFGQYITAACRARLSAEGSGGLRPVDLSTGVLSGLPVPGGPDVPPVPYSESADKALLWFFNKELAEGARRLSAADWDAAPQLVGYADSGEVSVVPFGKPALHTLNVVTDGEFTVRSRLLGTIPPDFVAAGAPLARAPGDPIVEWVCGPYAPVPGQPGRFRVHLDRAWKNGGASYIVARHEGDATTRRSVQPAHLKLIENREGAPQTIAFPTLPDVPAATASLPLGATSDAGLPVSYFVVSGPAVVRGNRLIFTPLPPRAKFPVEVTVAAWQWGRPSEPKIQTAPVVRQTFRITAP